MCLIVSRKIHSFNRLILTLFVPPNKDVRHHDSTLSKANIAQAF